MFRRFSIFDAKIKIILLAANEKNMFNSINERSGTRKAVFYYLVSLYDDCVCLWMFY